jgi:hypothetical protein
MTTTDEEQPVARVAVQESVPLMLVRMEGKLDRVQDRVTELSPRVSKVEERTTKLEEFTLVLSKNADAEADKKIALALALKEAEDNRRNQSEQSWTPAQRMITILGGIGGAITLVIYFYSTVK